MYWGRPELRVTKLEPNSVSWSTLSAYCKKNSPCQCDCLATLLLEIFVNFNRSHLKIYQRSLASLWQRFVVDQHFFPVPVSLCFSGVPISTVGPKPMCCIRVYHIQLWAVAQCQLPYQTKAVIMPTNIRPAIIEDIVWFSDCELSRREMLRIIGVLQGVPSEVVCGRVSVVLLKG